MAKNTIMMPMLAAVKRGFLKNCTSSIGWSMRDSHSRNAPSTAEPDDEARQDLGSVQPSCGASMIP